MFVLAADDPPTSAFIETALQVGYIFYHIVLPMLLLVGVGYLLQRRMGLHMPTLVRLNFYLVVPGIIYYSLVSAELTATDVGAVVGFHVCMIALLAGAAHLAGMIRGVPREQRNALLMTAMFYNSGNYGLPLQTFAFRGLGRASDAVSLQAFVMITQNIASFTLGVLLAAAGGTQNRHWRENLRKMLSFPPLYVLAAAVLTISVRRALGEESASHVAVALTPFWDALGYVADAFFAVALGTLGAQLALVPRGNRQGYPVKLAVVLRLLIAPAIGLGLIHVFGLDGFLAQVLLISTATPTAVNCMLLCMEFDNHPDFVARSVFYSTILSPITVTLVVFFTQGGFLARLALE